MLETIITIVGALNFLALISFRNTMVANNDALVRTLVNMHNDWIAKAEDHESQDADRG